MRAVFIHTVPGDPGLLPLKAINALMRADLLLASPAVEEEMKEFIPTSCRFADNFGNAVQLFPRPEEGASFLVVRVVAQDAVDTEAIFNEAGLFRAAGFETTFIPGVSRMQAVAAARSFPLTHRENAHSFWVLDAGRLNTPQEFSRNLRIAAASTATLVLFHVSRYREEALQIIRAERKQDMAFIEGKEDDLLIVARRFHPRTCS